MWPVLLIISVSYDEKYINYHENKIKKKYFRKKLKEIIKY